MQLQKFAEQVLYGTTLEEKLSFPREEIVDTSVGEPMKTPIQPPRPLHLIPRSIGERGKPPSPAKLIDAKERGRLLHFFANHELLATELMALALLKFPDAPPSFRRGLLDTLKEEQIHTRLYLSRMSQCGVEFGELPLSDYFWKSVSSMEDPLDYVTRLSLTFEQANLDYAREFSERFAAAGDSATAGILDKIYRDEIGHVGFGLKWFRRWKAAGKTDWEAYEERLAFPLSPARAKGRIFNAEGRGKAGLDPSFIDQLQLFQRSRGRTPSVYWFNPDAERFAAQNSSTGLQDGPSAAQHDLAFLAAYLSRRDDLLLMGERPSPSFLNELQRYGFPLPEIICPAAGDSPFQAPRIDRKIGSLRPWAWSPDSVEFFQPIITSLTRPPQLDTLWSVGRRDLYSKAWSADWGRLIAEALPEPWTAPASAYGHPAANLQELIALRQRFAAQGYRDIACKAPFASAARGNRLLLAHEPIGKPLLAWLESVWESQGQVVVEPWLNRVFDFSVQYEKRGQTLRTIAFTRLINNPRGQFQGILTPGFASALDPELARFLMAPQNGKPRTYQWFDDIVGARLNTQLETLAFDGPIGIDAFVYRDACGELRLKSVVEINPRYTMGRLAHELAQRALPGAVGLFQILGRTKIRKTATPSIADFAEALRRSHPVVMAPGPQPKIASGSFPLNDPEQAQQFLALYHVRAAIGELSEYLRPELF